MEDLKQSTWIVFVDPECIFTKKEERHEHWIVTLSGNINLHVIITDGFKRQILNIVNIKKNSFGTQYCQMKTNFKAWSQFLYLLSLFLVLSVYPTCLSCTKSHLLCAWFPPLKSTGLRFLLVPINVLSRLLAHQVR